MSYHLQLFGGIGALLLLIAFTLLEFKKIKRGKTFNVLNFMGSTILLVYAYLIQGYVFIVLNSIWSLVALYELIKK